MILGNVRKYVILLGIGLVRWENVILMFFYVVYVNDFCNLI